MFLGILTLLTALSISAVAIYYSVAGLMTIFAAAAIPIMIMGGVLEVGKLVTAVWLHKYWSRATWWLKTYLTTAVIVLMFITSMGIFGYLSKAHIEQTASANEGIAQIERIEAESNRNEQVIARAESKIQDLETSGTGVSNQLQEQIDREQQRIAGAYDRIQPAIDEQNQIIAGVTALFQTELDRIDEELARLQGFIDNDEIEKAQAMVGTAVDGDYGPNTARAFTQLQEAKRAERNEWLQKTQDAAQSSTVVAAREEITRLRAGADEQIAESNALINNLRNQLKSNDTNSLQTILDEQNQRIRSASDEIDTLVDTKFKLESEYRKLEAEVGPVKYIAEFVYGETADATILEEAVRWVILVIIFVFDPLAVLLLIAAQYTFEFRRKQLEDDSGERLRLERQEYERARAQRIVDNPGVTFDDPVPTDNDNTPDDSVEEEVDVTTEKEGSGDTTDTGNGDGPTTGENPGDTQPVPMEQENHTQQDEESEENVDGLGTTTSIGASDNGRDTSSGMAMAGEEVENVARTYITTDDDSGDMVSEDDTADTDALSESMESDEIPADETPEESERRRVYEELDENESVKNLKQQWKARHPNENLKIYKRLYIQGKIENLPWLDSYVQNSEQDENSLWNKINK